MYGLTKRIDLMCTCISTAQFDKKLLFWVLIFCQGKHKNIYFITKNGKGLILDKSAFTNFTVKTYHKKNQSIPRFSYLAWCSKTILNIPHSSCI